MITAVIIDDVPQAITTLKEDLELYCPDVDVIGTAEGVVSGAKLLRLIAPDILFLDVQMQDGTGFDLLELLGEVQMKVIFTTASDEHAIRAFRFSAVDYLLKPIDPDELVSAVKKAEEASDGQNERLDALRSNIQSGKMGLSRLALHSSDKVNVVKIEDIIRCESQGNYTIFYLKSGRQIVVTRTLKEYNGLLRDFDFIRIHQSHLVNAHFIEEFVKGDGGWLKLSDGTELPVSNRKRKDVVAALNSL